MNGYGRLTRTLDQDDSLATGPPTSTITIQAMPPGAAPLS